MAMDMIPAIIQRYMELISVSIRSTDVTYLVAIASVVPGRIVAGCVEALAYTSEAILQLYPCS